MRPATFITAVFLVLVAVGHLLRLAFDLEVTVQGVAVPMWASGVATLVSTSLAVGVWREHRRAAG